MPQLVGPIDRIARQKQRDVLFITFHDDDGFCSDFDWENCLIRQEVIDWLETNAIPYQQCFSMGSDGLLCCPYQGQLYLDAPYERNDPLYQKVEGYFENPDGTMRLPGVKFWLLPLATAMKNAHHDDPHYGDSFVE